MHVWRAICTTAHHPEMRGDGGPRDVATL